MSELDIIIQTITAAKQANIAALRALEAVEQMLVPPAADEETSKTPTETTETPTECQHADAVKVSTVEGDYLVCGCGVQNKI